MIPIMMTKEVMGGEWNEYGFDQLTATSGDREVFKRTVSTGLSVYDFPANKGVNDVDSVFAELEAARWL